MSEFAIPVVGRPVAVPSSPLCPLDPQTDAGEGQWLPRDLARRLCHVLDVAGQVVERLAREGFIDSVEPGNNVPPEKVVSETAFLLLAASTANRHEHVRTRVEKVARLLIPHARSERMLLGACLEPALALDFAQAHICLSRLGYRDEAFDALLRRSLVSQARFGRERSPHRMLEQEWLYATWRNPPGQSRGTPRAALQSVLGRPMDLLNGHRDDIYAFTHALMYVTDWNLKPRALPRARAAILADAEAALARCLDEQDYDLAAEVLLAWPLTGQSWSAAAAFAFRVLARVEDEAGFLPAPSTRLQRLNTLKGAARSAYLLATAYHTIYVMGLLCAAALQPGRTPPAQVPTGAAAPDSAALIVPFLSRRSPKANPVPDVPRSGEPVAEGSHWWGEFQRLNAVERDALAVLLLNIALRRKVVQRDFGGLRDLLKAAYAAGLADSPAASQAAELLERVALLVRLPAPLR